MLSQFFGFLCVLTKEIVCIEVDTPFANNTAVLELTCQFDAGCSKRLLSVDHFMSDYFMDVDGNFTDLLEGKFCCADIECYQECFPDRKFEDSYHFPSGIKSISEFEPKFLNLFDIKKLIRIMSGESSKKNLNISKMLYMIVGNYSETRRQHFRKQLQQITLFKRKESPDLPMLSSLRYHLILNEMAFVKMGCGFLDKDEEMDAILRREKNLESLEDINRSYLWMDLYFLEYRNRTTNFERLVKKKNKCVLNWSTDVPRTKIASKFPENWEYLNKINPDFFEMFTNLGMRAIAERNMYFTDFLSAVANLITEQQYHFKNLEDEYWGNGTISKNVLNPFLDDASVMNLLCKYKKPCEYAAKEDEIVAFYKEMNMTYSRIMHVKRVDHFKKVKIVENKCCFTLECLNLCSPRLTDNVYAVNFPYNYDLLRYLNVDFNKMFKKTTIEKIRNGTIDDRLMEIIRILISNRFEQYSWAQRTLQDVAIVFGKREGERDENLYDMYVSEKSDYRPTPRETITSERPPEPLSETSSKVSPFTDDFEVFEKMCQHYDSSTGKSCEELDYIRPSDVRQRLRERHIDPNVIEWVVEKRCCVTKDCIKACNILRSVRNPLCKQFPNNKEEWDKIDPAFWGLITPEAREVFYLTDSDIAKINRPNVEKYVEPEEVKYFVQRAVCAMVHAFKNETVGKKTLKIPYTPFSDDRQILEKLCNLKLDEANEECGKPEEFSTIRNSLKQLRMNHTLAEEFSKRPCCVTPECLEKCIPNLEQKFDKFRNGDYGVRDSLNSIPTYYQFVIVYMNMHQETTDDYSKNKLPPRLRIVIAALLSDTKPSH
ncbi:unnamed protein product [Caenorhabditis angaria]|uniref:Uncharacterized protein n=1 Tax=Caenorhabditis angaria TaxID=860376 RepID=A0A9P1IIX5_9PELO|nr:unnamed protein product [Caenorhabditis angaria]